jgi:bacteriocin-like protein
MTTKPLDHNADSIAQITDEELNKVSGGVGSIHSSI